MACLPLPVLSNDRTQEYQGAGHDPSRDRPITGASAGGQFAGSRLGSDAPRRTGLERQCPHAPRPDRPVGRGGRNPLSSIVRPVWEGAFSGARVHFEGKLSAPPDSLRWEATRTTASNPGLSRCPQRTPASQQRGSSPGRHGINPPRSKVRMHCTSIAGGQADPYATAHALPRGHKRHGIQGILP